MRCSIFTLSDFQLNEKTGFRRAVRQQQLPYRATNETFSPPPTSNTSLHLLLLRSPINTISVTYPTCTHATTVSLSNVNFRHQTRLASVCPGSLMRVVLLLNKAQKVARSGGAEPPKRHIAARQSPSYGGAVDDDDGIGVYQALGLCAA